LAQDLIDLLNDTAGVDKLALVIDAREQQFFTGAPGLIERLRGGNSSVRLIFLESSEETLIRRYSETRRKHPLDAEGGLRSAIDRESEILAPLRELADETLNTTGMSPHELRIRVLGGIANATPGSDLRVAFMSFGFKYGLPLDADTVFDVRFILNPYFVPELKELSGLDEAVRDYVLSREETKDFVEQTHGFIKNLLPKYRQEGKRYLTIAIGCTGGRHRSVAISKEIATLFANDGTDVDLRHRDVGAKRK
jgi:UPF0042 nucleotide-binding protein